LVLTAACQSTQSFTTHHPTTSSRPSIHVLTQLSLKNNHNNNNELTNNNNSIDILPTIQKSLKSVAMATLSFTLFTTTTTDIPSFTTPFELLHPPSANAAAAGATSQEKTDKDNIIKGYKRLSYLIDNWEKETTICGRGDNPYIGCERTPEKVMDYLGFKSMNDPLFRADKTLLRLQTLVPSDYEIDYMEAMEKFNEKAEEGNGIAFISSWGEANPGGGKDRIDFFIERSRKNLIDAKDSLGAVVKILDLNLN